MAEKYTSNYTGARIDEAVGKALAHESRLSAVEGDVTALQSNLTAVETALAGKANKTGSASVNFDVNDLVLNGNEIITAQGETVTLRNQSGTLALTSDIPDVSGLAAKALVVTITTRGSTYSADKTFAEISAAIAAGRLVVANQGGSIYTLALASGSEVYLTTDNAEDVGIVDSFAIYSNGDVERFNAVLQPQLVSGTNIKTINNGSLLGAGDIELATPSDVSSLNTALAAQITALRQSVQRIESYDSKSALYEVFGATFSVDAETGVRAWALNGLTDITDAEMDTIYVLTHDFRVTGSLRNRYMNQSFRTNLWPYNGTTRQNYWSDGRNNVDCYSAFRACTAEVIKVSVYNSASPSSGLITSNTAYMFYGCSNLKQVIGVINVRQSSNLAFMFDNCPKLRDVMIAGLASNIAIPSADLTMYSVWYAIEYSAATTNITITIDEVLFDAIMDDIEGQDESGIGQALDTHPYVHLAIP